MIQRHHGFWHVKLWEACFVAIVGLSLTDALLWPVPYAVSANQTAMLVSVSVLLLQALEARKSPHKKSVYPSDFRWPAAGIITSATISAWRLDVDAGAVAGLIGACLWVFNEVRSWRRLRASKEAIT